MRNRIATLLFAAAIIPFGTVPASVLQVLVSISKDNGRGCHLDDPCVGYTDAQRDEWWCWPDGPANAVRCRDLTGLEIVEYLGQ